MNRQAIRSMASIALYLALIIVVWAILAHVAFPGRREDASLRFVTDNETVLTQVAENALDAERWPGVRSAPEVVEMLAEGGVQTVAALDGRAMFYLKTTVPEQTRAIVYMPDGAYAPPSLCADWEPAGELFWQGGLAGKGYVSARHLSGCFFYEEVYLPT